MSEITYNVNKLARQNAILAELMEANEIIVGLTNEKSALLEENANLKRTIDKLATVNV